MKRLWGIRHIRWFYLSVRFAIWWECCGRYLGAFPNPADFKYLDAVWAGKA